MKFDKSPGNTGKLKEITLKLLRYLPFILIGLPIRGAYHGMRLFAPGHRGDPTFQESFTLAALHKLVQLTRFGI